jgi:hypothetical protein
MICLGVRGDRRLGLHRFTDIGRPTVYGGRRLQLAICCYCDAPKTRWLP